MLRGIPHIPNIYKTFICRVSKLLLHISGLEPSACGFMVGARPTESPD